MEWTEEMKPAAQEQAVETKPASMLKADEATPTAKGAEEATPAAVQAVVFLPLIESVHRLAVQALQSREEPGRLSDLVRKTVAFWVEV